MIPGLTILKNGIPEATRKHLLKLTVNNINSKGCAWCGNESRRLINYSFGLQKIRQPDLLSFIKKFKSKNDVLNHIIFQSYSLGHQLAMHSDTDFKHRSKVVILLLAGASDLVFNLERNFLGAFNPGAVAGDIIVTTGAALNSYCHGIKEVTEPRVNIVIRYNKG